MRNTHSCSDTPLPNKAKLAAPIVPCEGSNRRGGAYYAWPHSISPRIDTCPWSRRCNMSDEPTPKQVKVYIEAHTGCGPKAGRHPPGIHRCESLPVVVPQMRPAQGLLLLLLRKAIRSVDSSTCWCKHRHPQSVSGTCHHDPCKLPHAHGIVQDRTVQI